MNQETYNGKMINGLARLTTEVMLAVASDEEILGMVIRIVSKPGEFSELDLQELGLINAEMISREVWGRKESRGNA